MHNLLLGTGKHSFEVWIETELLTKQALVKLEHCIKLFVVPADVGRLPSRISSCHGTFTANQWKNWITIYSPVLLKGLLAGKPGGLRQGQQWIRRSEKVPQVWSGGHLRKNCPVKEEAVAAASPKGSFKGGERMVKCFNCRKFGHVSMHCPEKASYFCGNSRGRSVARTGLVEGTSVSDILLDTGCTRTMVRRDLIPEENLPGEAVTVLSAHGDTALYLLARVKIDVEGLKLEVKAAVSESLPVSALLGTDTTQLGQLLISNRLTIRTPGLEQALVSTRAQLRQQAEEEREQENREACSSIRPRPLTEGSSDQEGEAGHEEEQGAGGLELEETSKDMENQDNRDGDESVEVQGGGGDGNFSGVFAEGLFEPSVERRKLSRAQNRVERRAHGLEKAKDQPDSRPLQRAEDLEVSAEELQRLQETESDLARVTE